MSNRGIEGEGTEREWGEGLIGTNNMGIEGEGTEGKRVKG